ncbi:hypothetical protein D3C83_137140 [compost metagenome]
MTTRTSASAGISVKSGVSFSTRMERPMAEENCDSAALGNAAPAAEAGSIGSAVSSATTVGSGFSSS